MSHQDSEFHTVNQNIYGGMGGRGGVGGKQGGSGGAGEGPRITYGSIQTQHLIMNNFGIEQMNFQGIDRKFDKGNTREALASLKCVAARYNAANTPEKCMDGTRVNIIRDLVASLTSTPDSIRLVMLSGVAGSGKSTIAKTVATILAEEKDTLAASFFFSRDHTDQGHTHWVTSVAFSPDGKQIVSGSNDNTVRIWDAETGAALRGAIGGAHQSGHLSCILT
ncbi:NACHT-domain-containing protein [Mycena venus]|uniref:NACHT-domain-containing protein n=1 Tax=Mycena venus TaxID=2733690 RepID=A0A8H6XV18_9AGAR|nr:NACHT-domain-containing protein [Mycena venus]